GDGLQQRPAHEEALGVQLVLCFSRPARGFRGPQVQQLPGVVPLVDSLGDVDALVALEAQQLTAGPTREDLGHLGLADTGLALQQQWPVQLQREEDRRRQPLVGEIAVLREGAGDLVDVQAPASSRALRTNTLARWRRYSGLAFRSEGGSSPASADWEASVAFAPPASACSTAVARTGVDAMF